MTSPDGVPNYDLEPEPPPEPPPEPEPEESSPAPVGKTGPGDSEPPRGVKALDVCPNCGAPMRDASSVVCMRCGYSLKELKKIKTAVGEAAAAPADEVEAEAAEPLVHAEFGALWLPLSIAAASAVILAIGFLAGSGGLYLLAEEPSIMVRLVALLKFVLATLVLATGGVAGLLALAHLENRRVGDLKLAAARMLAIVATMQLVRYIDLPDRPGLEHALEWLLEAAAFVGLTILMFRMTPRQAATLLGLWVVGVIGVALLANAIAMSVVP